MSPFRVMSCVFFTALSLVAAGRAAAAMPTSLGYVQSGLLAQWDGYENVGRGVHESETNQWVDLVAGRAFTLTGVTVNDDRVSFAGASTSYGELPAADTTATFGKVGAGGTIEVVLKSDNTSNTIAFQSPTVVLGRWNGLSIVYCGSANQPELDWAWNAVATNTVSMHYKSSLVQNAAVNGAAIALSSSKNYFGTSGSTATIGTRQAKNNYHFTGSIYAIRLYDRELTATERARNAALDAQRFFEGATNAHENAVNVVSSREEIGAVNPGYGVTDNLVVGETYTFTAPASVPDEKGLFSWSCDGWELRLADGSVTSNTAENVTSCAITYAAELNGATLKWIWTCSEQRLGALRATGAQYFDTGVKAGANTRLVMTFRNTDTTTAGACGVLDNNHSGRSLRFLRAFEATADGSTVNRERFSINVNNSSAQLAYSPYVTKNTNWHRIDIGNAAFVVDDAEVDKTGLSGSLTADCDGTLPLLAQATMSTSNKQLVKTMGSYMKADLAGCKVYQGDELVRDLVPWLKADGTCCLTNLVYDAADETHGAPYYMNAGSGAFEMAKGPVCDGISVVGSPDSVGAPSPAYGEQAGLTVGESYTFTCPADYTNDVQGVAYHCIGWTLTTTTGKVYANEPGEETTCTFEYDDDLAGAVLSWKWSVKNRITIVIEGAGSVSETSQWLDLDSSFSLSATPAAGMRFWKWTGTAANGTNRYRTDATIAMNTPKTLTANFYDPSQTPRIVRYVKTAATGTKDGTSWENAYGSLATAYSAVADNPSGGEVWLAKGRHSLDNAIAIVPHINVRGGFVGTETSADEADPVANVTILSKSDYKKGDQAWTDGVAMWTGDDKMTYVDPADTSDTNLPFGAGYNGGGSAFTRTDGGLIEDNEISGVDFFYYASWAVKITAQNVSPLVFRNCRFLTCGWYIHSQDHPVNVANTPIEMYGCQFRGCQNGVYLTTGSMSSPVTTNVFDGCTFYACDYNWNCGNVASGIAVLNNAKLIVRNSVFDKCRNVNQRGDEHGGALYLRTTQDALVEDTVISRSATAVNSRGGGIIINGLSDYSPRLTLNRCRLEKCRYSGGGRDAHNCVGAAIGALGKGYIDANGTYFVGNVVTNATYDQPSASCIGVTGTWYGNFANCTFENNVAIDTAGRTERYTFTSAWNTSRYFSFANCVFNNNLCGYTNTASSAAFVRRPEFRKPNGDNEGQTYSFVNCVFANEAADYNPFDTGASLSWGDDLAFANCVSSSSCGWGSATANTFRYEPLDNETLAPLKTFTETNGVTVARGIDETSGYRRAGRPVYRAANGDLYIYDTVKNAAKPWRLLRSPGTVYTPEEGAARGLSRWEPIPEAFGVARSKLKCALGPLDWPLGGMKVIVR